MRNLFTNSFSTSIQVNGLPGANNPNLASTSELHTILSIVFGIVGALSLLVITISGLRYVISAGDPKRTAQAKEGIIYAIVGLVVAISAEAIVTFVVGGL